MRLSAIVLSIFIMTSLVLGQTKEKKIKLHTKEKTTKQEITNQIPIGSSINDAQRIMQANGFSCYLSQRNAPPNEFRPVVQENNIEGRFLHCQKEKFLWTLRRPWEALVYQRLWEVAIVYENGVVSAIFVSIWRHSEL